MRPLSARDFVVSCVLASIVLAAAVAGHAPRADVSDTTPAGVTTTATTTAHWRGNELVAPLPEDPKARAAALQRVRELNPNRPGPNAQVENVPLMRAAPVWPVHVPPRPRTASPPSETNLVPGLLTSFAGIVDNGAFPANPDIAAGPNHVLVTAGDEFAVYDKCGTWHDGGDIGTYFPVPGNIQFTNGRVIYDDWDNRWVMSFVGNTFAGASYIYVFVSNNSNPLSGWYFYALTVTLATDYPDDVHIAAAPDVFYFTFDQINLAGGFISDAGIWYLDKADLYANAAVTTFGYCNLSHLPDFVPAYGIRPTQLRTYDGNMYFVGCNVNAGNTLNIRTIVDPLGTPSLVNTVVNVPAYFAPPNGQQLDNTYIETGDARFTDIVYFGATIYATRIFDSGGEPAVYTEKIDPVAPAHITSVTSTGSAGAALDIDEVGTLTRVWSSFSTSTYPGASYSTLDVQPLVVYDSGILGSPQGAYQQGGFGTNAVPYQLADYSGAALDPTDRRTVWMVGAASSSSPAGTWRTIVGAASRFSEANLQITSVPPAVAGPPGGPFFGGSYTFTLTNTGNTTANWQVTNAPSWLTAGATSGALTPGASQDVTFVLNGSAYALPPGTYIASVTFDNCTGSGANPIPVTLGIAEPLNCALPEIDLRPAGAPTGVATSLPEVGLFVTAIGDIDVCAVSVDHRSATVANDITVEIYEADGTVRGALIASTTTVIVDTGMVAHAIPITAQLAACQDYEVVVKRSSSGDWNEFSGFTLPYDAGSEIRVRAGHQGGAPSATLPGISVFGTCTGCTLPGGVPFDIGKLSGPTTPPSTGGPGALASGAYIEIGTVSQVYGIGVRADIAGGQSITASVYDASSGARGALIASGNIVSSAGGTRWHDVPLAMTSLIGTQYEIEITCPQVTSFGYWNDTTGLPYTSYGAITVNDGVVGGSPDQPDLIYMRVHMCDEVLTAVGGQKPVRVPMRLAPPMPNPASASVTLSYDMTEPAVADMTIYDAKGRRVADVFLSRQLRTGPGTVRFDTGRLAAGVYFVQMETKAATLTTKLVVIR